MSKKPSASKRTNFTKRKYVVDPPLYRNTFQDHDRSECSTASRKKHLKVEHKPTGLYIKSRRIKSSESNTSLNNTIDETWMESQRNFDEMVRTKDRNEKENIISDIRRRDIATQIEFESIKKSQERTARVSKRNALISTKGTPDSNIRLRAMAENKTCNASTQSEMQEEEVTPKMNPDEGICTFDEEPGVRPPPPPPPPLPPPPEITEAELNKPPPPPNDEICTFDQEPGAKPPPPAESPPPGPPPPGPPPPGPPPSEPSPPGPPPPAPPPPGPPPSEPSPPGPPPPAPPHPAPPPPGPPPSGPPPPGPPPPGPPPPWPPHPAPPPSGPPSPGPPPPAPPPPGHPPLELTPSQELPLKPRKPENGRGKCVPPKRRPCCFEPRHSNADQGSRFTVCTPQDQSKIQNFEACIQQCMKQCREQFPMCRPQANQPNYNPRDGPMSPMNPQDRYGPNDFGGQRIPQDHGMDPCASRKALKFCNDVDRNNYPRIGNADYGAQAQNAGRNTSQTFQYGSSWGEDLQSYPYDRRSFGVEAGQPYRPPGLPYQQYRDPREFDPRHELYESSTPAYSYDGRCLESGADYGPMTPAYPHPRQPTYIPRPTGREHGGVRNVDRMNPPSSGKQYEPDDYDGDSARHRKPGKRGIKPCPKPSKELSSKSSNSKTKDVMEVLEQISGVINAAYHLYRDVVQNTAPSAAQQEESVPPIPYPCKGPRNAVFQLPDKINKNLESQSIWRQLETMSPKTPSKQDYNQRKTQEINEAQKNCALSEIRYIFH